MNYNGETLLTCRNLSKKIGSYILSDIHFELQAGYILGVIGRNGAGKTTFTRLLLGSLLPEGLAGQEGQEKQENPKEQIWLGNVQMQQDIVAYKKQIAFVLSETPFPMNANPLDCATLYSRYYDGFDRKKYGLYLKEFGIPEKVQIKRLSKGQQIMQQLAFALSYDAKLYIFDEPTGNLDAAFRKRFIEVVRKLVEDGQRSVIYVSHLLDELEQFADCILWIGTRQIGDSCRKGIQQFFGTVDGLKEQFQLVQAAREEASELQDEVIVGIREREHHQELLARIKRGELSEELRKVSRYATLKEIMYYVENDSLVKNGGRGDETSLIGTLAGK